MMTALDASELRVRIAKFASLSDSSVQETIDIAWPEWLDYLAAEPADEFVGGHPGWSAVLFDPPKRGLRNVRQVYAVVLDFDAGATFDAAASVWAGAYGLVYTTKSHTAEGDRFRVVLPLARPVSVQEHGQIWQWAAGLHGDQRPDGQCKDASRFWYCPTRPAGGWRALRLTGTPLDPDAILRQLDAAPKLRVARPPAVLSTDQRITRARAYLAKIPGAVSGGAGHTQTFNAIAAVMFGFDLSVGETRPLADEYNQRCDPPWSERELEHKLTSVEQTGKRERGYLLTDDRQPIRTARQAAPGPTSAPRAADTEADAVPWQSRLMTNAEGKPRRGVHNVDVFVRYHPDLAGRWSLNAMTSEPWFNGTPMPETMIHEIRTLADRRLGFSPSRDDVAAAVLAAATERPFHPVAKYLSSIDWDGVPRLAEMARDYLGATDELSAELVRRWMISAVARALRPGCKVDTALMLCGDQGAGKSTFFRVLGGDLHADSPIDIQNKDSYQQIHAAWIYEFAELENVVTGRAESRLKAWLSSPRDLFRAPYRPAVSWHARSCVICGTTNRQQFLTDETGSRRFWIVSVRGTVPVDLLAQMRDQLWAEAVAAYEAGERWWLEAVQEPAREAANEEFTAAEDVWQEQIGAWLANPSVAETSIAEVLSDVIRLEIAKQDRGAQMRASRALKALGWIRRQAWLGGGRRAWRYFRPGVTP